MRFLLFIGLLQLCCFNLPAQNFYVQISGDMETHVADIANSSLFNGSRLIAYNVVQNNGNADMGLMAIDYANMVQMSSQFHLSSYKIESKKVLPYGRFILAQKVDLSTAGVTPVILEINPSTGLLVNTRELPALPSPYTYTNIYDIAYDNIVTGELRILCSGTDGSTFHIFELHYNTTTFQCTFTRYSPQPTISEIQFLGYIKHYHDSSVLMGEVSFFGTAIMSAGGRKGFVFYKNISAPYKFEIYQFANSDLSGFLVNGADGSGAIGGVITMAMSSELSPAEICIQQKLGLSTLNWRRFYNSTDGNIFCMSYGRASHGIKAPDEMKMDYFIGTHDISPGQTKVTVLRYNFNNGDLFVCPQFNFTNINLKVGWPNFCTDPGTAYYFVVDRFNPVNGFKMAQAVGNNDNVHCTVPTRFEEIHDDLLEESPPVDIMDYPALVNSVALTLNRSEIITRLNPECNVEQRGELMVKGKIKN